VPYLYFGRVCIGPICGFMWILGTRIYFRRSWRDKPTLLGHLDKPGEVLATLRRLFSASYASARRTCVAYLAAVSAMAALQHCRPTRRGWGLRREAMGLLRELLEELRPLRPRLRCRRVGVVDV